LILISKENLSQPKINIIREKQAFANEFSINDILSYSNIVGLWFTILASSGTGTGYFSVK